MLESIKYYYRQNVSDGDIDDITCNDLDIDAVFMDLNHTMTSIGEEYLYAILRKPCTDISILEERENTINYIQADENERIKLQMALAGMGKLNKVSVYSYIKLLAVWTQGVSYTIFCLALHFLFLCACVW